MNIQLIVTPASGAWWTKHISKTRPVRVVYYDYNQKSLKYWEDHAPILDNVTYEFVRTDLLAADNKLLEHLDADNCVINLSNIFCYEATAMFYSLEYRLAKENDLLNQIAKRLPNAYTYMVRRACSGFADFEKFGQKLPAISIKDLKKPTWHMSDWNE